MIELFSTPDNFTYYYLNGKFYVRKESPQLLEPAELEETTKEEVQKELNFKTEEIWDWQRHNCRKAGLWAGDDQ